MLSHLTEQTRERVYLSLVIAAGLFRFINLGFLDMQAWDEAVYAVRAEGILRFGGWLDQTPFAIDGLYSSFHPPIYVWLTALLFHFGGINEFTVRFFSVLFGTLTLVVLYFLGKKIESKEVGFLSAMLFALNPFVTFFARQGQFDTAMVFFVSVAALMLVHLVQHSSLRFALLAGAAIGLGLMTKFLVAGWILFAWIAWLVFMKQQNRSFGLATLLIAGGVAAVISVPWHAYITMVHGGGDPLFFFKITGMLTRVVSGYEGNTKPTETLYYVNQLFVLFPLLVVWFWYGLWKIIRQRDTQWLFLALWFGVYIGIFSVARSKLVFYLLPALPPFVMIGAREIWRAAQGTISKKTFAYLLTLSLIAALWASSQLYRNSAKDFLRQLTALSFPEGDALSNVVLLSVFAAVIIVAVVLLYRYNVLEYIQRYLAHLLLVSSFLWTGYHVVYLDSVQYNDGGKALADFIQQQDIEQIIVAGYERNPQLTYYLKGADIGWREDLHFRRIIPPNDRAQFRPWLLHETAQEPHEALLVLEKDKFIRFETINPLDIAPPDFELVFESRRYACFQRITLVHMVELKQK